MNKKDNIIWFDFDETIVKAKKAFVKIYRNRYKDLITKEPVWQDIKQWGYKANPTKEYAEGTAKTALMYADALIKELNNG